MRIHKVNDNNLYMSISQITTDVNRDRMRVLSLVFLELLAILYPPCFCYDSVLDRQAPGEKIVVWKTDPPGAFLVRHGGLPHETISMTKVAYMISLKRMSLIIGVLCGHIFLRRCI
jgi:hypothetical protein